MAEIKSTLDLIMEKTKNLTLTEEEKRDLHHEELKSRVKGWVQRYEDRTIRKAEIERELDVALKDLLRREILERLDPESSNETLYQMLDEFLGIRRDPFESVAERFRRILDRERDLRRTRLLADLAADDISGSAVVPNPEGDREWNLFRDRVRREFREEIRAVE